MADKRAQTSLLMPWFWPVIVGTLIRITFVLATATPPIERRFVADPYVYLKMATWSIRGHWFSGFYGQPSNYLSIGYPFFIAVLRYASLNSLSSWQSAMILNILASIFLMIGVSLLAARIAELIGWQHEKISLVAVAAGWVMAVYPDAVVATGLVMSELLAATFLVWSLVLASKMVSLEQHRIHHWLGAALVAGLYVFIRPSGLLVPILIAFAIFLKRRSIGLTLRYIVVSLLPMIPIFINNLRVGAGLGITSATWPNICDGATNSRGELTRRAVCRAPQVDGVNIPRAEMWDVRIAQKQALHDIHHHFLFWVSRMPVRLFRSLWSGGWATLTSVHWGQNIFWSRKVLFAYHASMTAFVVLLILVAVGVWCFIRSRHFPLWMFLTVFIGTLSGVIITFGQARFGWPLTAVIFIPFASIGIVYIQDPALWLRDASCSSSKVS